MKKSVIIGILAVVILAVAGGLLAWEKQREKGVAQKRSDQLEVNTNDWKTYRNEEFGFEIKYPSDLITNDQGVSQGKDILLNLNIKDEELAPKNGGLFYNITIRRTFFTDINSWYKDWLKNNEKTIEARKTDQVLYEGVGQVQNLSIQGFAAKKYILGGYPAYDTCETFIKNELEYDFCYFGGARKSDYDYAKIGDDGYGNNKYDDAKMKEIKDKYRKLLDEIVSTFNFTAKK